MYQLIYMQLYESYRDYYTSLSGRLLRHLEQTFHGLEVVTDASPSCTWSSVPLGLSLLCDAPYPIPGAEAQLGRSASLLTTFSESVPS